MLSCALILLTALTISANVDALCEKPPTLPNREDNSPVNIFEILKIGEDQINYGSDRDVVVFMGLTGSGKTTFTLFIGGHDDDLLSEIKNYEYAITDKCNRTSTDKTHFSSLTLFPQRMIDPVSKTTYFDMPGFDDTRQDIVFDIASSYLSKRVLDFAERVKLVFLVNKSNVQFYRNRKTFIGLVNHITTLIRDVSKFENSIALVATKVEEVKKPVDHTDEVEVELILKFLSGARDILQKDEDEMGVKLMDIFSKYGLTKGKFNRIGIFRTPNDTGLLSDLPLMQGLKRKLKDMIDKDLQFGEKSKDDFTYTLSERSKNKIFELEKEVLKNTSAMINALSSKIKADFTKRSERFSDFNEPGALFKAAVIDVTELKEIGDFISFLQKYKKKFNVPIADEDLNTIQQNQESLDRLLEMSGRSPADWSPVIQDGMKDVSEYLQNQKSWYEFVSVAFDELSSYEVQISKTNYDLSSLRKQFKIFVGDKNVNEVELIELDTMKDFLNNINKEGLLTMYNSLRNKEMRITKSQLLLFEKVVNTTLDYVEDISCSSKTFTIKARYILLTKVEIEFQKCGERHEFVEIFALEKIFIDSSLDWTGKYVRTLSMIAPTWDTMGRPAEIILNGKNGGNYEGNAENGIRPHERGKDGRAGSPGGSAGHFLGIARNILAGESLTVSANGGNGGNGQNGGEGARGILVEEAEPLKKDQCTVDNLMKRGFKWDGYEQFLLCSFSEGPLGHFKYTTAYMVLARGSEDVNGSDGGDGGRGGQGGYPGKVALIDLDLFPNSRTKTISKEGVDGRNGTGGNGGNHGYYSGSHLYEVIEYWLYSTSSELRCTSHIGSISRPLREKCFEEARKHRPNGTRYHSGKAGDTGLGTEGWETPEIIPSNTRYNAINNYKIYVRENIADNLRKMMLIEFLHKMDQNSAVKELYDTTGFVNELLGIENHSYKLRDAINMRPFYQSILTRTLEYAQTLNTTNEKHEQYKKVLAFIYTTVLSKIVNYKYVEIIKGKIVIDVQEYLKKLNAELLEFKALRTKEIVDRLKTEYANEIDQKINEGKTLITSTISPQTEAIFSHIDKTLYSLIDTINTEVNQTKAEAEEAKKKLKEFERLMGLRGMFGAVKIVSSLFSLIPYGGVVSAALQGSIAVSESFVFNNEPGISSEQLTTLKKETEKITKALKEVYKEKLDVAKTQLKEVSDMIDKFQKGESDYPEIELPKEKAKSIRKKIDKILKRDEGLYSPSELENIRSEHDQLYKILKGHEKEAKSKKRKEFLKHIVDIVSLVDVPLEVYTQFVNDKKKRSAMAEVVKGLREKLKALEAYKHEVYATIFPTFENLNNNIKQTINSIDGKSRFGLNVAQWRVQKTIKTVQHQMTKMMKDYPQELEINFDMESLLDGMTKIIQMYDQIEAYREHVRFASYIANLHSANADNVQVEPELQSVIHRLETTIKANQIMFKYNSGIQIVKQFVFPFANFFMGDFALPTSLKFSDNNSFITDLVGQIAVNIKNLNEKMDDWRTFIYTSFDKRIHDPIWFGGNDGRSPALMIWKYEDYGEKIRKLLNGEAVSFPCNIVKGVHANAIKFRTVLFTFDSKNTTSVVQLYEKLKYFNWEMVHSGNSYYRCDNKYYVAYNEKLELECAFQRFSKKLPEKRNRAYNKIEDNDYILSPYTTWRLRLIPDGLHTNSSLSNINSTENFDLTMRGKGQYMDIDPNFPVCDDENLSEFYEEIKWKTSDINTPAMDQIKLVSEIHNWFNARSQQ